MLAAYWESFKKFTVVFTYPHQRTKFARYIFPVILLVCTISLRLFLSKVIGENVPSPLSTLVIILSAWYGGLGPGLEATALSQVSSSYFFPRSNTDFFSIDNILSILLSLLVGGAISFLSEAKRQTEAQKDEFIHMVSHEIKNPLTAIQAYATVIRNQSKQNTTATYARKIIGNLAQVQIILEDLKDLTSIEAGTFSYHDQLFTLSSIAKEVAQEQQIVNGTHTIQVIGLSRKKLYGDKERIMQVVTNLVTNAIKYSPKQRKIVIKIRDRTAGTQLEVKDYGMGIPEEHLDKIFQRFFRTTAARESGTKGLGLGLYIAQQIIKRHYGRLWVKSEVKKGTTFYVFLPSY